MLDKLREVEEKYNHLEASLSDPSVISDPDRYVAVMKEYKSMTPIVETYRSYLAAKKEEEELLDFIRCPEHSREMHELREIAILDYEDLKERMDALYRELTVLLLPRDPNDEKNVIVEIRAGAGGEEAALFAADLFRMYTMYATASGYRYEVVSENATELGGYREIVFQIEGDGAYSRFKFESGVHRVQRVPTTESQGRIQTSTATVAVLPEVEEVSVDLNPADIIMETCKSSGAGGQHINKTESAVRLIHKPTGIVVECQQERSQFKNKDKAMKMLGTILYDRKLQEQTDRIASERQKQVGTGDRSERIRTYNFPQGRITDHRIGLTLYSLDRFLNGEIGAMIDALATAETAKKLKAQTTDK